MSIPLVQNNEKDSINTSIIAIKRNIERINMLLGLSNSEEIDTSKFATKDELQQAVTDLQPVDEVAADNMHSVTSNAVANELDGGTWENVEGINYKRIGKMIFLVINQEVIYFTSSGGYAKSVSTGNDIVIPERYRPSMEINTVMTWNAEDVVFRLRLTPEGKLQSWNLGSLKTLPTGSDKKSWQTAITYCL